ncbi:DUF4192 family protein [Leucobacter sp. UT-8R-CII-1-4]|uniref:DUF4192 family protein n=1 Tax=Leucobacter sp. UT-8R-CII-1-4 TaxID=3040075 RepID=UPI0024A9A1D3|nr:DUF4192 family protein [Leucobacter sp. UT-8R-CII-1-4]MDI6022281.1 DUF4192 family protein [Leucobacter sp. UT-8R-CII-1-4]
MTHTVLRCDSAADLIAVIPRLTGFTDHNSVFLMLFQGKRGNRVLRFSLPEEDSAAASEALAEGLVSLLVDSGAGAATPAIVIRTERSFTSGDAHPWQHLTKQLQLRLRREGLRLREFALVAADGWCELLGKSAGLRRQLSELDESKFSQSPDDKSALSPTSVSHTTTSAPLTLESLASLPPASSERAATIAKHLHTLRAGQPHLPSDESTALQQIRRVARASDSCFRAVDGSGSGLATSPSIREGTPAGSPTHWPSGTAELARLIHAAQHGASWLVVALTALTRAEFVASVTAELGSSRLSALALLDNQNVEPGTPADWSAESLLRSLAYELPERNRLLSVIEVFRDAAAHSPEHYRRAVLALLAWAWWLLGLQSVAAQILEPVKNTLNDSAEPAKSLETSAEPAKPLETAECADHAAELVLLVQRLIVSPPQAHLNQLKQQFSGAKREAA